MGSKKCMNEGCSTESSSEWKKGWTLKSGERSTLCYNCGYYYENLIFCETFHREATGWRECRLCGKRIHCGCIASRDLYQYLDFGGVACASCLKRLDPKSSLSAVQAPCCDSPNVAASKIIPLKLRYESPNLLHVPSRMDLNESMLLATPQNDEANTYLSHMSRNKITPRLPLHDAVVKGTIQNNVCSFQQEQKSNHIRPYSRPVAEGTVQNKTCSCQQEQKSNHLSTKPSEAGNKNTKAQAWVASSSADGKRRSRLLPRYLPRITDEFQQLSGDLKSTVVPLFEKILSASDVGRTGRFVLPKTCAETYFPTINQSEDLPIRALDVKGGGWTFQFKIWPNRSNRVYVLEGINPCIQNLQLEAGDTVIFNRIDPGGKLLVGFRKATNNADL